MTGITDENARSEDRKYASGGVLMTDDGNHATVLDKEEDG